MIDTSDKNIESWEKTGIIIAIALLALGAAFLFQSPYMAFAVYAFLLLAGIAAFSAKGLPDFLTCIRIRAFSSSGRKGS